MTALTGKVALVTGGGRGVGHGVCLALAEAGASIAIDWDDRRDKYLAAVQDLYRQIEKLLAKPIGKKTVRREIGRAHV
jgi:3-oxoacyl-[acyl-carrier protein] reductase